MAEWLLPLYAVAFILISAALFHHYVARIYKAREWLSRGALLVDVDSAGQFAIRHPSIAIGLPLEDLANHAAELGSPDRPLVVFAHTWRRGVRAVHDLHQLGFRAVLNAAGMPLRERVNAVALSVAEARRRSPPRQAADPRPAFRSDVSIGARNVFGRILVPVDYSDGSRRALRAALMLQDLMGSEVHLFHLAEKGADDRFIENIGGPSTTPADLIRDSNDRLVRFVDNVCPGRRSDVSLHVHAGGETEIEGEIERMAKEIGVTLVLLSHRPSESPFRTHAERVARKVDAAVLLL